MLPVALCSQSNSFQKEGCVDNGNGDGGASDFSSTSGLDKIKYWLGY
jgi:hypothetical protein